MDQQTSGQHSQPSNAPTADLSNNLPYWNPALLGQLEKLRALILDGNNYTSHIKFPYMPSVTTVYINKNKLNHLPVFVEEIQKKFPNINMMNNEAAPSYFNGGSLTQHIDYRLELSSFFTSNRLWLIVGNHRSRVQVDY
uniref:Uncharacterized protein n=1 Tax=Mola mola TaxID=94237 RepID=A0A3Q4BX51_MOLML